MYLQGKRAGERIEPLERVTLIGASQGVELVSSVRVGEGDLDFEVTRVEQSHHVDFAVRFPGPQAATITYATAE